MTKTLTLTTNPFQKVEVSSETKLVPFPANQQSVNLPAKLSPSLVTVFRPITQRTAPLPKLPPRKTVAAEHGDGWVSRLGGEDLTNGRRIVVELPFHTPRYVNGATMRALLGGKPYEMLLKKTEHSWEICENDTRIDLHDQSVRFRVGTVAVLS